MGRLELMMETEAVSMYSPRYDGERHTEFEKFMLENGGNADPQLGWFFAAIIASLQKVMTCGARDNLFRPEGGCVRALPLFAPPRVRKEVGKMRLYSLRISERILILGHGGVTKAQKYEDDPVMRKAVGDLRRIAKLLKMLTGRTHTEWDDFAAMTSLIERITI